MEDDNIITLEVAIERHLLDDLIEAAQHRGQSISEFVETVLRHEVEVVRQEPPRTLDVDDTEA